MNGPFLFAPSCWLNLSFPPYLGVNKGMQIGDPSDLSDSREILFSSNECLRLWNRSSKSAVINMEN